MWYIVWTSIDFLILPGTWCIEKEIPKYNTTVLALTATTSVKEVVVQALGLVNCIVFGIVIIAQIYGVKEVPTFY